MLLELGPGLLTVILVGGLLLLLCLGLPIGFALGGVATLFMYLCLGWPGMTATYLKVWGAMYCFVLIAIPLFIFMGIVLERSGIADRLYDTFHKWLGGLGGGLAMGTVIICAIFAACTGIIGAATVTMAYIALPAMLKRGYSKSLALGAVMGGGTLGILIPPSNNFVIIGLFARVSIGGLFMGGVLSGLVVAGVMCLYIGIRCYFKPELGPPVPPEERVGWREKFTSLWALSLPVFLILAVLGSIFTGVATPTEAAAMGAFGSLVCAAVYRTLTWQLIKESVERTLRISVFVMWLVFGSFAFISAYTMSGSADLITSGLLALPGRWLPIIVVMAVFILIGMVMDIMAIVMITAPVLFPIIRLLGFSDIWFGVLCVLAIDIGCLTPPFGLSLFYVKNITPEVAPDITLGDIFRSAFPFVGCIIIGSIIIMLFPPIATWLPGLMIK